MITGIDYITQRNAADMIHQSEILMSNGIDVFNSKTGLQRYIDFFNSYERYMKKKHPEPAASEFKRIDPTPQFLEG